jgi:hypothetical protein
MKTSVIKMIATLAAVSLLPASAALAKNGSNGGNNGNHSNNGFKIAFSGNSQKQSNGNYNKCHDNHCYTNYHNCNSGYCYNRYYDNGCYYNGQYATNEIGPGQAFEPFHSSYVVLPGDSFYTVSLKEYGTSANSKYIARFNNMPQTAALTLGQTLMLPSISVNGALSASRAPVAESIQGTTNGSPVANFAASNAAVVSQAAPAVEAPRPKVTVGSTLLVDGQSFGDKPGAARLRVGAAALKVEVIEWNGSSVKIRLPQLDLAGATNADIEVVRADGSLAAKTGVELGAPTEVALAK